MKKFEINNLVFEELSSSYKDYISRLAGLNKLLATEKEYIHALTVGGLTEKRIQEHIKDLKEEHKMKNNIIFPYHNYSKSAKALALALGFQRVKREIAEMAFIKGLVPGKYNVINWGSYSIPASSNTEAQVRVINQPYLVKKVSNKLTCFDLLKSKVRIPEYTTDLSEALAWVKEGHQVLGRASRGSQGADICFYEDGVESFSKSEFWSKYKKKKEEYRVHVVGGEVILVQQKVLKTTNEDGSKIDTSGTDYRIRNLSHGFIFKRHDIAPPQDVIVQAKKAIEVIGLDFGAVDVIYNASEQQGYVLEINTAPGLEGTTVEDYAGAFKAKFFT